MSLCHRRQYWIFLLMMILSLGCAKNEKSLIIKPYDLNLAIENHEYVQRINNFIIVLDMSISMSESYKGRCKYKYAIDIIRNMVKTIPNINATGAFRTYGAHDCAFCKRTTLLIPPTKFTHTNFEAALGRLKSANGESPLDMALSATLTDLKGFDGKTAVFIISDFKEISESAVQAASTLQKEFGDRLYMFNILMGNDLEGIKLMQRMSSASRFTFSVSADEISSAKDMAAYVQLVFLEKTNDSDTDGVSDEMDRCPNTPIKIAVDEKGCPKDTDGDGVYDSLDHCPHSLPGVKVEANGCAGDVDADGVVDPVDLALSPLKAEVDEKGRWVIKELFQDSICSAAEPHLKGVIDILLRDDLCVELHVVTDTTNLKACNQTLSEIRGQQIKDYLIANGVPKDRVYLKPLGIAKQERDKTNPAFDPRIELKPVSCEVDSDGDGIGDFKDECPNTPRGLKVDATGCPILGKEKVSIELHIQFAVNTADIDIKYHSQLKEVAEFMMTYGKTKAVIEAHTDNLGNDVYNLKLSQKRAESVVNYLVKHFGVPASRLSAIGYGETKPIDDNSTKIGRQRNRRAVAVISAIIDK